MQLLRRDPPVHADLRSRASHGGRQLCLHVNDTRAAKERSRAISHRCESDHREYLPPQVDLLPRDNGKTVDKPPRAPAFERLWHAKHKPPPVDQPPQKQRGQAPTQPDQQARLPSRNISHYREKDKRAGPASTSGPATTTRQRNTSGHASTVLRSFEKPLLRVNDTRATKERSPLPDQAVKQRKRKPEECTRATDPW